MNSILTKFYSLPEPEEKEILRYAASSLEDSLTAELLKECLNEALNKLSYSVCYLELPLEVKGDICRLGDMEVSSKDLAKRLKGSEGCILFAATVGVELDRLITKYGRLSPSKALLLQAIGAERIEALCDAFCEDIKKDFATKPKPRFSPGYGDLPLSVQRDIFSLLECEKRIGLTLTDGMLMAPTKSVTAIIGID